MTSRFPGALRAQFLRVAGAPLLLGVLALTACGATSPTTEGATTPVKAASSGCTPGAKAANSPAGLPQVELCATGAAGKVQRFTVEVAATPQQQAQGLMFRTALADDAGMIFPFGTPKLASFWMKNTVIPLDIIFIRADGTIANIAAKTEPYSLNPVSSEGEVAAVLELRGGRAAELGIAAGSRVRWK